MKRPPHTIAQGAALAWLAKVHCEAEGASQLGDEAWHDGRKASFERHINSLLNHCGCGPDRIAARSHVVPDIGREGWDEMALYDVRQSPRGLGFAARMRVYTDFVSDYFEKEYAGEDLAPRELVHVSCTGYASPSGAQRLVTAKGWGATTRVTHAYHMGCYAAFPALRIATGSLSAPASIQSEGAAARVDIVHTELCSLHLDPSQHSVEQLVVQSLFGDGLVRYSVSADDRPGGFRILALDEQVVPASAEAMGWVLSDVGMQMTLDRNVPEAIAGALRPFVQSLFAKAGLELAKELPRAVFAVHPGGPKIIDRVRDCLELREDQVRESRAVLLDHGNMSSATLPHVWMRIAADPAVKAGTLVISLAFGPGLTVCGGVFRKA